jgi:hypothetical protein
MLGGQQRRIVMPGNNAKLYLAGTLDVPHPAPGHLSAHRRRSHGITARKQV